MSDTPQPALTPEEWRDKRFHTRAAANNATAEGAAADGFFAGSALEARGYFAHAGRHALAALALHGQPFGFTREDLSAMEVVYRRVIAQPEPMGIELAEAVERLHATAAKLAALLPPEEG